VTKSLSHFTLRQSAASGHGARLSPDVWCSATAAPVATRRHAGHNARSAPSFCPDAVQPAPAPRAASLLAGSQSCGQSQATSGVGRRAEPSCRPFDQTCTAQPFPTRPHSSRRPTHLRSARQTTISSRLIIAALCHTFESACRHARLSGVACRSCRPSRVSRVSLSASCERAASRRGRSDSVTSCLDAREAERPGLSPCLCWTEV
jgi:hypothetical protein